MGEQDWTALAEQVRERRVALGLRQHDLEARGGPSNGTVRNIEQAAREKYSARSLAQLERALEWPSGTARGILDGGDAPRTGEERAAAGTPDWSALADEVRKRRELLRLPIDLTAAGGPAEMTVRKIESGEPVGAGIRGKTKTRLEHALRMREGLIDRILDGAATQAELDEIAGRETASPGAEPCACVVGSPAWIERELAAERRINAIAQVFQGEVQRLLTLVDAARRG